MAGQSVAAVEAEPGGVREAKVVVREAGAKGMGVFANEQLKEGTWVCMYHGTLSTDEEIIQRYNCSNILTASLKCDYLAHLDDRLGIDAQNSTHFSRYFNHAEYGNLDMSIDREEKQINFFAARDIEVGEELTFDYGPRYWLYRPQPESDSRNFSDQPLLGGGLSAQAMSPGTLDAPTPQGTRPQPCPRVTAIADRLLLGGLGGGLSAQAIECILQEFAITHLVICGHRGTDAYVAAAESAAASCSTEIHVAPLIPSNVSELPKVLDAARAFVADSIDDELNCVLVACSKGASRSVAVVISHLLASQGLSIAQAFETVVSVRWRVWPSALLVETLLDVQAQRAASGGCLHDELPDRKATCQRIGSHAALATAWHNGAESTRAKAEDAWDAALKDGGSLEAIFARCKQSLLGLSNLDLGAYSNTRSAGVGPAHAEFSQVATDIFLGGLGGLSATEIAALLPVHGVQRVLVCGRPGKDAHVDALQAAVNDLGLAEDALHIVPVADSASEDLRAHISAAVDFACTTKDNAPLLIACRQGASRSVSVAIAYIMRKQDVSVLTAFQHIAEKRWRLWPNAGFVEQLLQLEDDMRSDAQRPPLSDEDKTAVRRKIGVYAAWAANRQNLEENGFGRHGLTLNDVDLFWEGLAKVDITVAERFERCKEWALGVDLSAFENVEPAPKRPRNDNQCSS